MEISWINTRLGFQAETDESDGSFISSPLLRVILIDDEHIDFYNEES